MVISKKNIFYLLLIFFSFHCFSLNYKVKFIGLENKEIITSIKNTADIFILENRPPRSINALRYRVDGDIIKIIKTFHAYGYFDANVSFDIEDEEKNVVVYLFCDLGPRYILHKYDVCYGPCNNVNCNIIDIPLEPLGIILNKPTNSKILENAKKSALFELGEKGYPLAKIDNYQIIADGIRKTINVKMCVDTGPLCHFGPLTIEGLRDIYPKYIYRKLDWKEGEKYTPDKVAETQMRLLETNLFSSVSITHKDALNDEGHLPMKIHVIESKHQNISLGANYATVDGPGIAFGYTNYNLRHMGEVLTIQGEVSKRAHTGNITYKKPDFLWFNQNLAFSGYALRENIRPYLAFTYGGIARITHEVNKYFIYSYGMRVEYISVNSSANNGKYEILGAPFYFRLNTTNHLLNPTKGYGLVYTFTPYTSVAHRKTKFIKQRLIQEFYVSPTSSEKITFAFRLQLGSIVGPSVYRIPMTKLFLSGSDDDLRGYRYKTVGPRNSSGGIIGGRSAIYMTFEPRMRLTTKIGLVPFIDIGNIQTTQFPTIHGKWRKSVGGGIRYFTFFGPLRLDVGFPLDKYKKDDPSFRFYVSIGQSF